MRIIPLGGAEEVGASSTIVEFGRHRVLVDAGIRIGVGKGEELPDLERIQREAGELTAIFLTHAHMDHSGALPLVHLAYQNVPIYMTPATASVVRILLSDSIRLMSKKYELEGEIPLYPQEAVESCLGSIRPVPFDYPIRIAEGDISVTFHPAGHILGASSVALSGNSGSILISGDISVTEQRTIPGMLAPNIQPDVIMVESTYGDRLHAHRPTQEAQLVRTVAEIIESGGKVIFPAFAVGRAQEIILILRQAIANGDLPAFPIFVDGMVQSVCDAYSRFPSYLQRHLRHSLRNGENPFFPAEGTVYRVRNAQQRQRVLDGPPCCIVASSGMMTGGPSAFYASQLGSGRNNLIAITGYQDEEAPGRRLLDLADAAPENRILRIHDRDVRIHSRVEKYSLSAHADSGQIAGLIGQMSPSQGVVLVHGDDGARNSLASTVDSVVGCNVYMPGNGQPIQFKKGRRVFYAPRKSMSAPRIGGADQPLDERALAHLHQVLWSEAGKKGLYGLSALYARWYGPNSAPEQEELDALKALLDGPQKHFLPDPRRPHMYRLRVPGSGKKRAHQSYTPDGVMEMNRALQAVSEIFPDFDEVGLYRKGAEQHKRSLRLSFRFPKTAKKRYQDQLQQLEALTGWQVVVHDKPHHAALESFARECLPQDWELAKNPSIHHDKEMVVVRVFEPEHPTDLEERQDMVDYICHQYTQETGLAMEVHFQKQSKPVAPLEVEEVTERLEINRAFEYIKQTFAELPHQPYKRSKKDDRIVLSFLSPGLGERYKEQLHEISEAIGWPIEINPEPNQYGIKQEVRSLFPPEWQMTSEPGVLKHKRVVRVRLDHAPGQDELEQIAELIFERTGFHLELADRDA